jgi:hypothetical protein
MSEKSITPQIVDQLSDADKDLNNSKSRALLSNLETGINNSSLDDKSNRVQYNDAPDEKTYPSLAPKHNTFIVFGRDRLGDLSHGYGGKGQPKAGAIDIVVGRHSKEDASTFIIEKGQDKGRSDSKNANPFSDASRIYLSQKADIDEYFSLPLGFTGNSKMRAAIAIKSDDIRIISRNTFKIITNSDNECSNGEMNEKSIGLQLIAVNNKSIQGLKSGTLMPILPQMERRVPGQNRGVFINDLQPMVKGDNLIWCLKSIIRDIRTLNGIVKGFMETQKAFNEKVATHTHLSPFLGNPTSPSPEIVPEGISAALKIFTQTETGLNNHLNQLQKTEMEYLDNSANVIHINSQYHKLN